MRQPRGETRLVEEHRGVDGIVGELALELLHDDELLEAAGAAGFGQMDDAHAATRQLSNQPIAS